MAGTVLLVADREAMRQRLGTALAARGWRVAEACRGPDAVEQAKRAGVDVILLDVSGGAQGEATARLLKLDPVTCRLPIVVLSAVERPDGRREPWAVDAACATAPCPTIAASLARAAAHAHGPKPFVLVVDDEADLVEILTSMLEQEGFAASGALDGQEALEVVRTVTPDVLLLDLDMPRVNGWQVLEELRERKVLEHIRVVILTGREQTLDAKQRGLRLGASDYLLKPCEPDAIVRALRAALAAKEPT